MSDALVAERDRYKEQATFLGNKVADLALELGAVKAERDRLRRALAEALDALRGIEWQNSPGSEWARDRAKYTLARIREALK